MTACDANRVADRDIWRRPAPLGVGLPYLPDLDAALYTSGLIDFVEITPDILCRPRYGAPGMVLDKGLLETARDVCGGLPIVVHGVELSIGSAGRWNDHYVAMLESFQQEWPFAWHSEHLHFQTIDMDDGCGERDIGVPLPLPFTQAAAATVANRTRRLNAAFGVPFLLENGAHYLGRLPRSDGIQDEAHFLNRIAETGDCGFLLDLHNLHCNAVNNGDDAAGLIDALRLDRVGEIHIAGGRWSDGFRLDSHDGRTPQPVWALLDDVLPRCPHVGGVVFEIMADHARRLGPAAIVEELGRLRAIWTRHKAVAKADPCLA
ncbi:DUF692 domain-containing protein [Rhizorhabdus histidinilytica]|uniref:DUF692 domain-containing protein n=1 Tax=Rhizorhabdus histidinilytica TaxID=439228 RepID=UPI0032205628